MNIEMPPDAGLHGHGVSRRRVLLFAAIVAGCAAVAGGYATHAVWRAKAQVAAAPPVAATPLDALPARSGAGAAQRPYLLFRSAALDETNGRIGLAWLDGDDARQRYVTPLRCDRVHFAAGRGICLEAKRGALTSYHAHLFDPQLRIVHSHVLAGAPSRARVSADGRLAATTVFVSGHSYATPGFSTRTSIVDATSGRPLVDDLEQLEVQRDGRPFKAADFNFWGVTFTPDATRYYATLQTAGRLYLVEGDVAARRMRVIHDDVECPSLSPDGSRIAFKRRMPAGNGRFTWRLHLLELSSRRETALAETRHVDDQVEWLGEREIAYALNDDGAAAGGVASSSWALAVDDVAAKPRLLVPMADSPTAVR